MNQYIISRRISTRTHQRATTVLSAKVCELLIINISTVLRSDLIGMRLY
jgi:hypothetical protein